MSKGGHSPRRRSREAALQVLYAVDVAGGLRPADEAREDGGPSTAESTRAAFDDVAAHFELPAGAQAFAKELVCGVTDDLLALDELVGEHARNWRVERMAAVDRNILRLAAYEIRSTETPVSVVLDAAVELARRFGSDTSPAFVNGVLDAVANSVRGMAAGGAR